MNIVHLSEKYELNDLEKQIIIYIQEHLIHISLINRSEEHTTELHSL